MWIVQEVTLARETLMICGENSTKYFDGGMNQRQLEAEAWHFRNYYTKFMFSKSSGI